jgi:tryptophan synthase alpha chain
MAISTTAAPAARISAAIAAGVDSHGVALVPFVTAGYPQRDDFIPTLRRICEFGDVVEVGVPFSDPMADGVTIQRSSHSAIEQGVSLKWILAELAGAQPLDAPVVLMSYLNPLLSYGFEALASACLDAGVCGFIVPDLPWEESGEIRAALDARGLALIQLVTPATPPERAARLCAGSSGFVYAVTVRGTTGGDTELPAEVTGYLDQVSTTSDLPVCAGFGVRTADDVARIAGHASGVIVGSALVEELEAGRDPGVFLEALRR